MTAGSLINMHCENDNTSKGRTVAETAPLLPHHNAWPSNATVSSITMFWEELRSIPQSALPVLGSVLLEFSFTGVQVISVGHISTPALAAVSLGSMTANVTGMSIISGLASALDTLLPSAYTSSRPELVGLWSQRMAIVLIAAMMPILVTWWRAESILLFLKQDPEIARLAALYLRWFTIALPAVVFNHISRRYFQCQGYFSMQTRIFLLVAPINVLLNYLLVWGPKPLNVGYIGAPISVAISHVLVAVFSILYAVTFLPRTKTWHPISSKMFTDLGTLTRLGLYGVGQLATEWWAWEILALAASFMGPVAMASQSIILTSAVGTWHVGNAVTCASGVRVGNLLGSKNPRRARAAANASILMVLFTSLMLSSVYMTFRHSWATVFSRDPEVIKTVASVIPLIAFFQIVDANTCLTGGLLRATGRQFTGALLNISAYFVLGLPLGIYLALALDWHLHGLWTGVTIALLYCSIIGTTICLRLDWKKEVESAEERITKNESGGWRKDQAGIDA